MENDLTIKQICSIIGKSNTSVYRLIKGGKLPAYSTGEGGQRVWKVKREDLEGYLGHKLEQPEKQVENISEDRLTTLFQKVIWEQSTALVQPMEQMAIYRCGKLENEVKHLIAEKEVLLQEIQELKGALNVWKTQEQERVNKWWKFW